MPIDLYPSVAKVKRNGVYQNLPGFVQASGDADIKAMIANSESSTTAQYAHPQGSYFILNDILYKAIIDIAVNDTIAVGTNCEVSILGDSISELESAIEDKIHYDDILLRDVPIVNGITNLDWDQGTINYNTGVAAGGTPTSTRLRSKGYQNTIVKGFTKLTAKEGYLFSVLVYDSVGTYKGTLNGEGVIAPGTDLKWFTEFIPISDEHYYKFVIKKINGDANITPLEGYNNITITTNYDNHFKLYENLLEEEEVTPETEEQGKLYNFNNKTLIDATNGIYRMYRLEKNCIYHLTTEVTNSTKVAFIQWFDEGKTYISAAGSTVANKQVIVDDYLTNIPNLIPSNAVYMGINYCSSDPFKPYSLKKYTVPKKKDLSILFVGNSLTQDGVAYLPYMLKTYFPEINFNIHVFYNGGYTLAQQYADFQSNTACDIYSIADNSATWKNYNNATKMQNILKAFRFDIICLQEYFNYKESYSVSDLDDFNNCRDYITANYLGDNALEFITFFHAPLRSNADNVYELTEDGNALILQKTIAQDMIPAGMAIYNAMSTSLDSLGDASHLSNDGTHAQEGLPCLLETFTILCWLLDKLGINKSIYGSKMRMTSAIYNTLNVPGPNLGTGLITGTDAQNLLAQEVAIQSYKQGKQFVMQNIYSAS